jgi:hypothetical protein
VVKRRVSCVEWFSREVVYSDEMLFQAAGQYVGRIGIALILAFCIQNSNNAGRYFQRVLGRVRRDESDIGRSATESAVSAKR